MKLKKAAIFNYKTIASETILEVDDRITALLGKSESGKTNILEAIYSVFREDSPTADEPCSWPTQGKKKSDVMVQLTFELEEGDGELLIHDKGASTPVKRVQLSLNLNGDVTAESDGGSQVEDRMSDDIRASLGALRSRLRRLLRLETQIASKYNWPTEWSHTGKELGSSLLESLQPAPSQKEEDLALERAIEMAERLRQEIAEVRDRTGAAEVKPLQTRATRLLNDIAKAKANNVWDRVTVPLFEMEELWEVLPIVEYIPTDEKTYLTDKESVSAMIATPSSYPLHQALLRLGGLDFSSLAIEDRNELQRRLDRAKRDIGQALTDIWTQEPVEITLDVVGDDFRVQLKGPEGHYGTPSQRSEGFLWFISFYLRHLALAEAADGEERRILLVDEPGLYLHASAQQDLLRLFDKAGERVQIIYTTHSPFMVNKNYPHRIRQVEKDVYPKGTRINNRPYHSQHGLAWEPVRTAIGVTAGNSLFIAGQNLVVEGISDQILLAAFSQSLTRERGQVGLDLDTVAISPADGASSAVHLAHLCGSCCDNTVVLLDSDNEGKAARERLIKAGQFPADKVLLLGEVCNKAATVEDLVAPELYHRAVYSAYRNLGASTSFNIPESLDKMAPNASAESADVPSSKDARRTGSQPTTVGRYNEFWKRNELGEFSKVLVARELAVMSVDIAEFAKEWAATHANFGHLFDAINASLARKFKRPASA